MVRSIGEAPVIYSPFLTDRSVTQLKLYLNNKGFYKAEVTDSVWFKKKKAHVVYRIYPGPRLGVKGFTFREDSSFRAGGLPESSPLVQLDFAGYQSHFVASGNADGYRDIGR